MNFSMLFSAHSTHTHTGTLVAVQGNVSAVRVFRYGVCCLSELNRMCDFIFVEKEREIWQSIYSISYL